MNEYIGVDLGGTNFKAGRVSDGKIVLEASNPVHQNFTESELFTILFATIDALITKNTTAIGVGVPGIVDPDTGIIYDIINLPAWETIPLRDILEGRYSIPVHLNNDANCFAKGEYIYGAGKAYNNFVGLSIGTGLGMGIIIERKLHNGLLFGAGEIGMVTYKDSIIEYYVSSLFFERNFNATAKELSLLATQGDATALQAYREFGLHLGNAINNINYMIAPEAIVLGGSISKAFPLFKKSMEETLKTFAFPKQTEHLVIEVSGVNGIAVLGAAALCID
jgi:glucokinase